VDLMVQVTGILLMAVLDWPIGGYQSWICQNMGLNPCAVLMVDM